MLRRLHRQIIWQARNQAIHFEEGNFHQKVIDVFTILELENGPDFALVQHQGQSRAKQIINLLGWNDYALYSSDIQSLLP